MKQHRFSLRKHKLGVLSIAIGTVVFLGQGVVYANDESQTETPTTASTEHVSSLTELPSDTHEETEAPVTETEATHDVPVAEESITDTSTTASAQPENTELPDANTPLEPEEAPLPDEPVLEPKNATPEVTQAAPSAEEIKETTTADSETAVEVPHKPLSEKKNKLTTQPQATATLATDKTETTASAVPTSLSSNDIVTVNPVWQDGYKGEGMLVAVIDSGLDIEHDVLRLSNLNTAKYRSKEEIEAAKAAAGITYGKWYNDKVVFGYNYVDANTELKEVEEDSHGMHVTGIAAGNPSTVDSTGEYVYGVAPEAQVMFMRVFVDRNKTTDAPLYARAIEDAVKLGADSINLSLGSAAGSLVNESPAVVEAIEKARRAGVTVVIAAGNDGTFGKDRSKPLAENPDYGLVGSPSVARDAISVASFNNTKLAVKVLDIIGAEAVTELNNGHTSFTLPGTKEVEFDKNTEYEYVYANLGKAEDFKGLDVKNKVALIRRGEITFTEKITNALNNGAIGAIIFNNKNDGDDLVMSIEGEATKIPSVFIPMAVGEALAKEHYKLHFNDRTVLKDNPAGRQLSDFTSWGLTSDGELKPDVAAPGGAIYSSINNNKYASMNGTSMASPHVAGIALLVKQHLIKTYPDKSPAEIEALVKHLIMSTAKPHFNEETKAYTSPRQQGAGVADTAAAIHTTLYVTGKDDYSSIGLGNVSDTFTFDVLVHNFGNQDYVLNYETIVNTDGVKDGKMTLTPRHLVTHAGKELLVRANSSEKITVSVDTASFTKELTGLMPNGYFLEGFVRFLDKDNQKEVVSIPYVGFKGAFQDLPVIEVPIYDLLKEGKDGFYYEGDKEKKEVPLNSAHTGLVTTTKTHDQADNSDDSIVTVGSHETKEGTFVLMPKSDGSVVLAISPNGDDYSDSLAFQGVFFRNFEDLVATVYAKDDVDHKHPLWKSDPHADRKNYFSGIPDNPKSHIIFKSEWDGTDTEGNDLADGEYDYVVTYYPMVPGAKEQSMTFHVVLDREAPIITTARYDEKTRRFTPRPLTESGSGILRERLVYTVPAEKLEDGTERPEHLAYVERDEQGNFVIPEKLELKDLTYLVEDHAGNRSELSVADLVAVGNEAGRVFVKLVNHETKEPAGYTFAYAVRDENGQLVDGIDKSKDYISLPFGTYTVDILLYDKDNSRLVGETSQSVTVSEQESVKTITFEVTPIDYAAVRVDLDKELPENSLVSIVDKDGNTILLPAEKYSPSDFGKQVPVGLYDVKVDLPSGYELYEGDLSIDVLQKQRNVKHLTLINKNALHDLFAKQEEVMATSHYYNASTATRSSYDRMVEAVQQALAAKRTQAEIDALVADLTLAQANLDGRETDSTLLANALAKQEEIRQTAAYYNASRTSQQAYETALRSAQLGLSSKTQAEIDDLLAQLQSSQAALDGQETNKQPLETALVEGRKLAENDARYQYASEELKEAYSTALNDAQRALENTALTQAEADQALATLLSSQEALNGKALVTAHPDNYPTVDDLPIFDIEKFATVPNNAPIVDDLPVFDIEKFATVPNNAPTVDDLPVFNIEKFATVPNNAPTADDLPVFDIEKFATVPNNAPTVDDLPVFDMEKMATMPDTAPMVEKKSEGQNTAVLTKTSRLETSAVTPLTQSPTVSTVKTPMTVATSQSVTSTVTDKEETLPATGQAISSLGLIGIGTLGLAVTIRRRKS